MRHELLVVLLCRFELPPLGFLPSAVFVGDLRLPFGRFEGERERSNLPIDRGSAVPFLRRNGIPDEGLEDLSVLRLCFRGDVLDSSMLDPRVALLQSPLEFVVLGDAGQDDPEDPHFLSRPQTVCSLGRRNPPKRFAKAGDRRPPKPSGWATLG